MKGAMKGSEKSSDGGLEPDSQLHLHLLLLLLHHPLLLHLPHLLLLHLHHLYLLHLQLLLLHLAQVAAAWNSCVRLSCLQHGVTVHTQFDLVSPFPRFEPKVSLKRDNCVVVNTGNFLHSITVDLEVRGEEKREEREEVQARVSWQHPLSPPAPLHPISVVVGPGEVYLGPYSILPHLASPGAQCSPASRGPITSDSDLTDCESEASQPSSSS